MEGTEQKVAEALARLALDVASGRTPLAGLTPLLRSIAHLAQGSGPPRGIPATQAPHTGGTPVSVGDLALNGVGGPHRASSPDFALTPPDPSSPPIGGARAKAAGLRETAVRLVEFWRETMERPRAKTTPERVAKVTARLKDGYTEADIRRAIIGCSRSSHHTGTNEQARRYDDIALICRTGEKLEGFIDIGGGITADDVDPEIESLKQRATRALEKGNEDEYEKANEALRGALRKHEGR